MRHFSVDSTLVKYPKDCWIPKIVEGTKISPKKSHSRSSSQWKYYFLVYSKGWTWRPWGNCNRSTLAYEPPTTIRSLIRKSFALKRENFSTGTHETCTKKYLAPVKTSRKLRLIRPFYGKFYKGELGMKLTLWLVVWCTTPINKIKSV